MVRSIVPEEYDVHLPYSTHTKSILESESFDKDVVQVVKAEFNITVELKTTADDSSDNENDEIIALKMTKGNLDRLNPTLEVLIAYLKNHQVNLYDDSAIVRHNPALSDPAPLNNFPIFDKMIPSALPSDLVSPTPSSSSSLLTDFPPPPSALNNPLSCYSLFDYPGSISGNALDASWKNFRDMNSPRTVENIRAIFDSPESNKLPPPPSVSLVSPLSFRGGPPTSQNGLDIWSNPPQQVALNGFGGSPPMPGLEAKPHSMMYSLDQNNSSKNNGFYQPLGTKPDFNAYVVPTSSTSTGSNNSSMHSSQSMPDIMLEERQSIHTSPKKSSNLPFQINNYIHTQTPPPLIYPSNSTTSSSITNKPVSSAGNSAVQFTALSSSVSTPTAASATNSSCTSNNTSRTAIGLDKSLDFPALFSLNHSSADETVIVQSLLNNMSIGQSNNLTH
ncbi:unnamed protein product [Mucor hiemalis]